MLADGVSGGIRSDGWPVTRGWRRRLSRPTLILVVPKRSSVPCQVGVRGQLGVRVGPVPNGRSFKAFWPVGTGLTSKRLTQNQKSTEH